jgi:ribokinase
LTVSIDVLCIGDLDMDLYIAVPSIPGFDQKISGRSLGQKPGGMAANAAVSFARLGRKSRLIAAVGDDAAGTETLARLSADGVDLSFVVKRLGVSTFTCVVLLSPSGEKSLIRLETEAYLPRPDDLAPAAFEGIRHVHSTYGSPDLTAKAFEMADVRGLATSLDLEPPDIRHEPQRLSRILQLVKTLFLNNEAAIAASDVLGMALHPGLLKPDGEIIITLGAGGCRRIAADGVSEVPAFKVRPIDTTGAGDCFVGAYLTRRLEGADVAEALQFANAAAALATLDFGAQTAMPLRGAVENLLATSGRGPPVPSVRQDNA